MGFFYVLNERVRILLADDDPIMREFASVYLSSPHADVVTVGHGRAAVDALVSETFDILLLDLEMPEMNGFEVLEHVRSDPASTLPVIVITGREDFVSIDRAYALGASSFANKPVNWRVLAYQVKYVLRNARCSATPLNAPATESAA